MTPFQTNNYEQPRTKLVLRNFGLATKNPTEDGSDGGQNRRDNVGRNVIR